MPSRSVKILSIGKYLPKRKIYAEDLDKKLNLPEGWTAEKAGVLVRHYVENETASQMGALAAKEALSSAGLTLADIDCIVCASGTGEQEIPCTAALIQKELGGEYSGIPSFDINSTCLSFVTAMDLLSYLIDAGRYKKVLIVSSEITSVGLNWEDKESCTLFGDGAAAVIIEKTPENETSKIFCSDMKTYSKGAHYSEIKGGGTNLHPREYSENNKNDFLFYMDGKKLYKMSAQILPAFIENMLKKVNLSLSDMELVIPHQASFMAMKLTQKNLKIPEGKFLYTIGHHGNTVAASIPMALYDAIESGRIKRGDKIMFLGISAGMSVGAMAFEY